MIIVNFKNYKQGKEVVKLAKFIEKINKKVIICVQATDIYNVSKNTKLRVYAQHVSPLTSGRGNGFVIPEAVKINGGVGTLINHSEHPLYYDEIARVINLCKKHKLKTICCVSKLKNVKKIAKLKPDAIAFEDPKLISTGKSITKYNSKTIEKFVDLLGVTNIPAICGAGISSKKDIKKAIELGCHGVLISNAVANNKNLKNIKEILKEK